jgi:glycosyltransferase involved in cell wall biosynthesis
VYAARSKPVLAVTDNEITAFKTKYRLGKYVLFVGNSHPHKNLDGLIQAMDIVTRTIPDVILVVVGYMNPARIDTDKVRFLGHLPDEEIPVVYASAELCVFPTLYEGFGLPALDSMAYSCPAVVSDVASLPEVAGDAAVYIDPYNPSNIADGIIKILSDTNLRQELVGKGAAQVKKFSWHGSATKFADILKNESVTTGHVPQPAGLMIKLSIGILITVCYLDYYMYLLSGQYFRKVLKLFIK